MIRIRSERRTQELFDEAPRGFAVGSHTALLHYDVAFLVKLTHHRIAEAVALNSGPELDHVRRHRVHVGRLVVARAGVHTYSAVALDDLAELVLDDELVRSGDRVLPGFLQLRQLLRILAN